MTYITYVKSHSFAPEAWDRGREASCVYTQISIITFMMPFSRLQYI